MSGHLKSRPLRLPIGALILGIMRCDDGDLARRLGPPSFTVFVQHVSIADLGTPSFPRSVGIGANNLGEAVGIAFTPTGEARPFHWRAVSGMTAFLDFTAIAEDINDIGQIVGGEHSFLWSATTGLRLIGPGRATSVNNLGQVVGFTRGGGGTRAYYWSDETGVLDLGTSGGMFTDAAEINDRGEVVGSTTLPTGERRAFRWTLGADREDLGDLGGGRSFGNGINNAGQIVGSSLTAAGEWHLYAWSSSLGMLDLGTPSRGRFLNVWDINDIGQVVLAADDGRGGRHSFLWTAHEGFHPLPELADRGAEARAISEAADNVVRIVGTSVDAGGVQRAVMWMVTLRPATPAEELVVLYDAVRTLLEHGALSHGVGQSLLSKLDAATRQLADGNAAATVGLLQAFIRHIEVLVGNGTLSHEGAAPLIAAAQNAILQLGG